MSSSLGPRPSRLLSSSGISWELGYLGYLRNFGDMTQYLPESFFCLHLRAAGEKAWCNRPCRTTARVFCLGCAQPQWPSKVNKPKKEGCRKVPSDPIPKILTFSHLWLLHLIFLSLSTNNCNDNELVWGLWDLFPHPVR